jgi:uncharacterized protein YacL
LRSENFVAFFTVCGFFIGLIFSVIKFDAILDILFYTATITLFFYLFIHVVLIFYLSVMDQKISFFEKESFESECNAQIREIKERESKIDAMLRSIHGDDLPKEGV